jgi:hypothetical protein
MIEAIINAIAHALSVLQTIPREVWAVIAGTSISWGVTQRAKFLIPFDMSSDARHRTSQLMAFLIALAVTFVLWPTIEGALAGFAVGLWSPWSYGFAMRWIGQRWPRTRAKMSQDVRP